MIRPLRRAHWRWMVTLTLALLVALVLFLGARDFSGRELSAPLQIGSLGATDWRPVGSWVDLQGDLTGRVRWVSTTTARGLEFDLAHDLAQPEVLAYWSGGESPVDLSALPASARLLTAVEDPHAGPVEIAAGLQPGSGRLLLYSLGHSQIVGWADLETP